MQNPTFITPTEARNKIRNFLHYQENLTATIGDLKIGFEPDESPNISFKGRKLTFIEKSYETFCKIMRFPPVEFIDCLYANPKLRDELLDFCLSQISSDKSLTFTLAKDSDEILSVDEQKRSLLSPLQIFDYCIFGLPSDTSIESIHLNHYFEVRVLTSISDSPPKRKGDISRGGVFLRASNKSIEIGEYAFTLLCLNGLWGETSRTKRKVYGEQDSRKTLNSVKETTKAVFSEVKDKFLPALMESDEIPVKAPTQLIHRLARENRLAPETEASLLDRVPSLPEASTYYDVINMVTSYAREAGSVSLQKFGGKILKESSRYACNRCHRPLR